MVYALNSTPPAHENLLSPNDIFWIKRDGARVLICRAGDLIDSARLQRFENLEIVSRVDEEKLETVFSVLQELRHTIRPKDKMKIVSQVRKNWSQWFSGPERLTPIELIILGQRLMQDSMRVHIQAWAKASMPLFHRSCVAGLLNLCGAVALGYASWPYLEDLWRLSFSHSASFGLHGMTGKTLSCLEYVRTQHQAAKIFVEPLAASFPSVAVIFKRTHEAQQTLSACEMNDIERWFTHIQKSMPWDIDLLQDMKWWDSFFYHDKFFILGKMGESIENMGSAESEYIDFEI